MVNKVDNEYTLVFLDSFRLYYVVNLNVNNFSKNALIMLRRIPDPNKIRGKMSCGNPKAFWKKD